MSKFYVYGHYTADTDELFYIGKGTRARIYQTRSRNPLWHNVVDKHGLVAKILYEGLTEEESAEKEKELIKQYGRRDINTGCLVNMTDGGEGWCGYKPLPEKYDWLRGKKRPEEVKIKMREAQQRRRKETTVSEETRKKLREASMGKSRQVTEEIKQLLSEKFSGEKHPMYGKPRSEVTKRKIREANLGKKHSKEVKEKMKESQRLRRLREKDL